MIGSDEVSEEIGKQLQPTLVELIGREPADCRFAPSCV